MQYLVSFYKHNTIGWKWYVITYNKGIHLFLPPNLNDIFISHGYEVNKIFIRNIEMGSSRSICHIQSWRTVLIMALVPSRNYWHSLTYSSLPHVIEEKKLTMTNSRLPHVIEEKKTHWLIRVYAMSLKRRETHYD